MTIDSVPEKGKNFHPRGQEMPLNPRQVKDLLERRSYSRKQQAQIDVHACVCCSLQCPHAPLWFALLLTYPTAAEFSKFIKLPSQNIAPK